jgi:heptosyltransferase II
VTAGFDPARVENLAGKTDLVEFGARLRGCGLLVTNDTGGMHLANVLGVPLIALFGPTNPIRTAPVFSAPVQILQPPNCPATGGGALVDLPPAAVVDAIRKVLD